MKKLFTLFAIACIAISVNAQNLTSMQAVNKINKNFATKGEAILTWVDLEATQLNCLGGANYMKVFNRFEPNDLAEYSGYSLVGVAFLIVSEISDGTTTIPTIGLNNVNVEIYQGATTLADPGTLVCSQPCDNIWMDSLYITPLATPVALDITKELWIGYSLFATDGYPIAADSVTSYNNKGNIAGLSMDGNTYEYGNVNDFMGQGMSFDGDFFIIGFITDGTSDGTSIKTIGLNTTNIYPNPTTSVINIDNAEGAQISLFDINGKMVYTVENAAANQQISTDGLTQGLYIARIINGNDVVTRKINVVR